LYIWEKYWTLEMTSGIILKMNLPLYKGFTLEITNKWWPLTTLNKWPLYRIKIYSKMHRESTEVTVMSRWPLYKGNRYDRFDCTLFWKVLWMNKNLCQLIQGKDFKLFIFSLPKLSFWIIKESICLRVRYQG
jgi:hypothetical protein